MNVIRCVLVAALLCCGGSASADSDGEVVHVVMVWLKQPGNEAHRQQLIDGSKRLQQIPGVIDLQVGSVIHSDREVVEDSFDVALSVRFEDHAALQNYLQHPLHLGTVKSVFVPIMDHYRVLDFTSQ